MVNTAVVLPTLRARPPFSAQVRVQRICITRIIANASTALKSLDKNGDGIVTRAELDAYMLAKDNKPKRASCACGPAPKPAKGAKPNDSDDDGDPSN